MLQLTSNRDKLAAPAPQVKRGLRMLFSRRYRARTALATIPWFLMDIATYGVGLFTLGIWMVPRFGRIRMQTIGFAGMALGMFMLLAAVGLTNSSLHIPLVFVGFILFNLLMNAGPNSTTFTLAPILFPTELRGTAGGFAAGAANSGQVSAFFSCQS